MLCKVSQPVGTELRARTNVLQSYSFGNESSKINLIGDEFAAVEIRGKKIKPNDLKACFQKEEKKTRQAPSSIPIKRMGQKKLIRRI